MDLLFKRYASPFLFIDGMIQTGRFTEFVDNFISTHNKEKEEEMNWEFFLHKISDPSVSFKDFLDELETNKNIKNMDKNSIESTVKNSLDILNNFNPVERGE